MCRSPARVRQRPEPEWEAGDVSDGDRERWDARHAAAGRGGVPAGLGDGPAVGVPVRGRALDVACGRGGVAVWLARRGLAVDAVDVSPVGLAAGARLAAPPGSPVGSAGSPTTWTPACRAGCRGPYDVVVCQLFRDPPRYADLVAALAPGGLLAITVLSEVDAEPGPFRAPPGELRTAFSGLETLLDRERDGEATLLARRLALRFHCPPGSPPAPRPRW